MIVKLKIGVYTEQRLDAGGGFNEALSSIIRLQNLFGERLELLVSSGSSQNSDALKQNNIKVIPARISKFEKIGLWLRHKILSSIANVIPSNSSLVRKLKAKILKLNSFERRFVKNNVDLVFFPAPEPMAKYMEETNYILSVWDLAHREMPYFPELRNNFDYETREHYFSHVIPRALLIVVGHDVCKSQLITYYKVPENKIIKIPFSPAKSIIDSSATKFDDLELRNLKVGKFIFYPAQYWAHKNHRFLIDLLYQIIKRHDPKFKLVFTGSDKGNIEFLRRYSMDLGIGNSIIFCGFVSSNDVRLLYEKCASLIMPSFIGPGTLPTLEGLSLGTLVIVEDTAQNRDFYGPNMIYQDFDCEQNAADVFMLNLSRIKGTKLLNKQVLQYIEKSSEHENFEVLINRKLKYLKTFRRI